MKYLMIMLAVVTALFGLTACSDSSAVDSSKSAETEPAIATKSAMPDNAAAVKNSEQTKQNAEKLPRLIDFGSKKCVACKAMEPILESCEKNHADKFVTEFIDVWVPANQMFAKMYKIQSIPTQVFVSEDGKELFRHVGFISEEDILAKWAEFGYKFAQDSQATSETELNAAE